MIVAVERYRERRRGSGSKAAPERNSSSKAEEIDKGKRYELFLPRA
jgi:hypothetical protein